MTLALAYILAAGMNNWEAAEWVVFFGGLATVLGALSASIIAILKSSRAEVKSDTAATAAKTADDKAAIATVTAAAATAKATEASGKADVAQATAGGANAMAAAANDRASNNAKAMTVANEQLGPLLLSSTATTVAGTTATPIPVKIAEADPGAVVSTIENQKQKEA